MPRLARRAGRPTATQEEEARERKTSFALRVRPLHSRVRRTQAIEAGGFVFVSGQLALRPGEKELSPGQIPEENEQVFANLRAILVEAGSSLEKLMKTTVFLQNLDDFAGMNQVYVKHVGEPEQPPARSTVEAARLPSGVLVEIEAIALAG